MPKSKKRNGFKKKNEHPINIEVICTPGPSNVHGKANGKSKTQQDASSNKLPGKSYAKAISQSLPESWEKYHEKYWAASHSQSSLKYEEYSRSHQCCPMSLVALIELPKCPRESFTKEVLEVLNIKSKHA